MKDWLLTIIAFLIIVIIAFSIKTCQNSKCQIIDENGDYWKVIVIDSCEYIERFEGHAGLLSHKGNCRFCKERNKNKK